MIKTVMKFAAALLCALLLASCAAQTNPPPEANQPPQIESSTLAMSDMAYKPADSSGIIVHDFDLGNGELKNILGQDVPCPLEGIIAAPSGGGPYPLVMIFHGATRINSIHDKIYAGFDYLVKQLAAEGYVAVSVNVNVEYTFDYGESLNYEWAYQIYKQHMDNLERANAGKDPGYGVDLASKIDFSRVYMIGHSRGGELADAIVRREQAEGLHRIKSLLLIQPGTLIYDEPYPDIPTGIVLGEFDGDVPEDGQYIFDYIQREPGRKAPASLVYLRGANHNFFNRAMLADDGTSEKNRLTREQQEDFLTHYAGAFLSMYAKGNAPWGIWDVKEAQPVSMFGYAVTASYFQPGRRSLLSVSETGLSALQAGGAATVSYTEQTPGPGGILFHHPGGSMNDRTLPLYRIGWNGTDGAVSLPMQTTDLSNFSALSLFVAADSSDGLNPPGKPQAFTVTLKDGSGMLRSVLIPAGTSALAWHSGEAQEFEGFDTTFTVWSGQMPLGELRIPLSCFEGLDFSKITECSILLNQTPSGAVMTSGLFAV